MRLESYCVVSNRTGIPFQLMQWQSSGARQRFDNEAGGGTELSDSRGGLPKRRADTPLQPGLRAAIQDPAVDWTSCLDLPVGKSILTSFRCTQIVKSFAVDSYVLCRDCTVPLKCC